MIMKIIITVLFAHWPLVNFYSVPLEYYMVKLKKNKMRYMGKKLKIEQWCWALDHSVVQLYTLIVN